VSIKVFFSVGMFYICLISIFYLATTPLEIEPLKNIWDKVNHFVAFFTLYIMLSLAHPNLKLLQKVLILLFYGVFIEFIQFFLPYREFSLLDIVADGLGIVIGIVLLRLYISLRERFFGTYSI